ncbi:MAG: Rpn family recombination-promoting nuclease/putative transposase [Lachnospiraceae bacterium]|nr:Rpn family recombination-promoting nuclease/putative transposase [Lachnospiraceae bacterium]
MKKAETTQTKAPHTSWEELGISNDFLFGKIMQDQELCKELIQMILPNLKIDHIEYPELQKTITPDMDAHGVRLDVYVKDDKETVYDIEMQVSDTKELPKRSRHYQGMIDLQLIDRGQHYKRLNQSYIIFICPFDLYGKGRHIYTFENICKEDNSLSMGDGTVKIFLNTEGMLDDTDRKLKAFLDYVAGKEPEDPYVEKLKNAVKEARKNRKWRHEYMTLSMRDQENIEKGREEGLKEGEAKGIFGMISSLRDLNIPDSTILQQLQEKFLLTKEESLEYLNH